MKKLKINRAKILTCKRLFLSTGMIICFSTNIISSHRENILIWLFKNKTIPIICTGYNSEKKQTDNTPFITAINQKVGEHIIAVSRPLEKILPMGTKIEINNKNYIVGDRMSKRWKEYRIDFWFQTKQEALKFGKQTIMIKINGK